MASIPREKVTAAEFAKLPETTSPIQLIDGEIIEMPGPTMLHQILIGTLFSLLRSLVPKPRDVFVAPMDVQFDEYNTPQPDIFWVSGPDSLCKPGDDGIWHGAPDLIVDILSPGTAKLDRGKKFQLYEQHGVREYWMADAEGQYLEVWPLIEGKFQRQSVYGAGDSFESAVLGRSVELTDVF